MTQHPTLLVKHTDLPRRIVLLVPDGNVQRQVAYILRITRSGGLLLNKDELDPSSKQVA